MKKFLASLFTLVFALSCVACTSAPSTPSSGAASTPSASTDTKSSSGTIKVGFAQVGHESDWRTASTKSVQAALSKDNGFDLQFIDCDNDSAKQIEAVRNFIQQGVDYIVIDPIVSTGWDTVLGEAQTAKIPVIVLDRTIDDSDKYVAWIGSEFTNEGLAAGQWLKDYAAKKGIKEINALVIEGTKGSSAQIGRTKGFKQYADTNGWKILDSQDGAFTQDGGQKVMESYCKSYKGKFNVVVCQNDNEAFGAMDAMKTAGINYGVGKDVIVISFDSCKAALQNVLDGKINADFQCNPLQGEALSKLIKQLKSGATVDKKQFMAEGWYVSEPDLKSITYTNVINKSVTEDLIQVTKDIISKSQY